MKNVKIRFTNGLNFESGVRDILGCVGAGYHFIESAHPDYIVFGPYGNNLPEGDFVKIGYYCEDMAPDMSVCDWAFGMRYEKEVKDPKYMRIQWHGFDPNKLIKKGINVEEVINKKRKFCNFVYSNKIDHREKFFRQLSKYKPVDAPGKSMNNMASIDTDSALGDIWCRKRRFISQYKFTIAFENHSYPGYHTEKLLDPMMVNSLPIYWGNPNIHEHFNPNSFINTHEHLKNNNSKVVSFLESTCQKDFSYAHRSRGSSLSGKVKRKMKAVGRNIKIKLQFDDDFDRLIERIIEIDKDDNLYAGYLSEPWFHKNTPPSNERVVNRWREIFG